MATLPTLYPTSDVQVGTWTTDAGGTTNLWQKIEEGIAGATDTNDFIRAPTGTSNTTANQYEVGFTDTPTDFLAMETLSVNVRYNQTGRSDDTLSLVIRVESSAGTAYTNDLTIANITTTAFTNSGVTALTLTSAGLAAIQSDWDGAYIVLSQTYTASMANDNARVQVSAIELTGSYTPVVRATPATISAPVTINAVTETATGTVTPAVITASVTLDAAEETSFPNPYPPTLGVEILGSNAIGLTNPVTATNATATPAVISITATPLASTETATATRQVSVISITATPLAPTETATGSSQPAVINATATPLAPTETATGTVTPVVIAASASPLNPSAVTQEYVGVWGIDARIQP